MREVSLALIFSIEFPDVFGLTRPYSHTEIAIIQLPGQKALTFDMEETKDQSYRENDFFHATYNKKSKIRLISEDEQLIVLSNQFF